MHLLRGSGRASHSNRTRGSCGIILGANAPMQTASCEQLFHLQNAGIALCESRPVMKSFWFRFRVADPYQEGGITQHIWRLPIAAQSTAGTASGTVIYMQSSRSRLQNGAYTKVCWSKGD